MSSLSRSRLWLQRAALGRFAAVTAVAAPWVIRRLRREGLEKTLGQIEGMDPRLARLVARLAGQLEPGKAQAAVGWTFRNAPHLEGECLEQALTQYTLQRTDAVRFVVGVHRDQGDFGAHAWVEATTNPRTVADFSPIMTREGA